jgi:hypothetical protein
MRKEIDLYDGSLKQAILDLPYQITIDDNGVYCDMIFIPESDYGFAEIYRMYDDILVFLIPTYGGTPSLQYHVGRHSIDYLIKQLKEIT